MMIELRKATDIETLCKWREEVILNVFGTRPSPELMKANEAYYARNIADGNHLAIIASVNGVDCGCGAICLSGELPSPDNPSGRCAYLMNIYVREAYRERGVAHTIIRQLITEATERGCGKIFLETTDEGRSIYVSLGFEEMNDMMKLKTEKL
ncbi:MAG: GNAT family N-acetyltransferase [Lachnoclostridium sp.]|nr:GNAT family N-acetyltransferase [Lachnoclostridium sp.]